MAQRRWTAYVASLLAAVAISGRQLRGSKLPISRASSDRAMGPGALDRYRIAPIVRCAAAIFAMPTSDSACAKNTCHLIVRIVRRPLLARLDGLLRRRETVGI